MSTVKTTGTAAVVPIVRYGETKAHIEVAMRAVHTAMAITPWFEQVEPLGEIANQLASQLAIHAESFRDAIHGPESEASDD